MKTQVFEDGLYYICHDGRELHHIRAETKEKAAQKKNVFKNAVEGLLRPKIHIEKKKYEFPVEEQVLTDSLFYFARICVLTALWLCD